MLPETREEEIQLRKNKIEKYQKQLSVVKGKKDRKDIIAALAVHKENVGMELNEEEELYLISIRKSINREAKRRNIN